MPIPGSDGGVRIEGLESVTHMETLRQNVKGSLTVPGEKQGIIFVNIFLDSGSGVTAIPEAVAKRLQMQFPRTRVIHSMDLLEL